MSSNDPTNNHPTKRTGKHNTMEVETISPGNLTHEHNILHNNEALSSDINSLA